MKKRYLLITIILFLSLLGRANADVGELRYDVTNLTISDNGNITFKGWAFLHKTQNFVTVNKMNNDGKETNEILKQIEVTQSNQSFFVRKYTQNKNIDISVGYKEFLQNIVEYKYELNTLKQIKQDITMKQTSNNYNKKNEKKLNNKHYTESISPYISKKNFTDSLRIYSNQTSKEKPPFVPFTSPYSRLFSSENKG